MTGYFFKIISLAIILQLIIASGMAANSNTTGSYYLNLLKITQNAQSKDFVKNKTQFQLHTLYTEQSHPKTSNLSYIANSNPNSALSELFSVDADITKKVNCIEQQDFEATTNIKNAVKSVKNAILRGNKIYIYGTGSTGRLAKQIENIWFDFWSTTKTYPEIMRKLSKTLPTKNIQNLVIGEITGADKALVKSLEGFEDLQLVGKLQLQDHNITNKDVVFAVTEGGETSAVIGTILKLNHFTKLATL